MLAAPSPSGYEAPVQAVIRKYAGDFADEVRTDVHGNVVIGVNVARAGARAAGRPCDQIGLVVTHIDDNGFIYTLPIGGWDPQQLIGQRMTIWTQRAARWRLSSHARPFTFLTEERKQVVKLEDSWLDIGAGYKAEAAGTVRIGDPVTLELSYQELRNGLANSPGMDNKTGAWVVVEALRRAKCRKVLTLRYLRWRPSRKRSDCACQTSAYGVDPHVGIRQRYPRHAIISDDPQSAKTATLSWAEDP